MSFEPALAALASVATLLSLGVPALAQDRPGAEALAAQAELLAVESLPMLRELLAIPNDAHHHDDIELNVRWCEQAFAERGFGTRRLATEGLPLLLAQLEPERSRQGRRTVLVYLQMDGQPVDATRWQQQDPHRPVLMERQGDRWSELPWSRARDGFEREWRVFARSASDAKGPVAMFLAALDGVRARGWDPPFDLKVIMDFEEELGSPRPAGRGRALSARAGG